MQHISSVQNDLQHCLNMLNTLNLFRKTRRVHYQVIIQCIEFEYCQVIAILVAISLPATYCVCAEGFKLTELALGPGQGPLPPGPLRGKKKKSLKSKPTIKGTGNIKEI